VNWQKYNIEDFKDYNYNIIDISFNSENLKPDWVEVPAQFTEFHVRRGKKSITVVIGESWTYGESLPDIATGLKRYSLQNQLRHCFGPKLSLLLDSDFYQYAVPGNCNAYMYMELPRILQYVSTLGYEKINLFLQITEPSREMSISHKIGNHPITSMYDKNKRYTFDQWLILYDEMFLDLISVELRKYSNIECVVWKNFCCFQNRKSYNEFRIYPTSWIRFSGKIMGEDIEMQRFQSVGWLNDLLENYKNIEFNNDMLQQELDKIEKSNEFIKGNYLHNNHPNQIAHSLWAFNLYNFFKNNAV
jgi:hypothetical protein